MLVNFVMAIFSSFDQLSMQIETTTTVGLKSKLAQIEFDKDSGRIVKLALLSDKVPSYLNAVAATGNPFTFYCGVQPLEDTPIGGHSIHAREFQLRQCNFENEDQSVLKLTCSSKRNGVELESTLKVETVESGAFDLTLSLTNASASKQVVMADFPSLSGIILSDDLATDLSVYMRYAGASGTAAWKDIVNRYGGHWTFQFDIVYNQQNNRSLGYMILDEDWGSKSFHRTSAGAMKVLHLPSVELEFGQMYTWPTARLMVVDGSWKVIAREYGNWIRSKFDIPTQPRWYQETNDFRSLHLPDWGGHIGGTKFETSTEFRLTYFDHFLRHGYLTGETMIQEVHGWRNWGPDKGIDPTGNRADLGGNEKMRKGIKQAQRAGRKVNSYFGASTGIYDVVETNKPREYFELMHKDGSHFKAYPFEEHHPRFGFRQATMCPGLNSWRQWIVHATTNLIEHGFDGFRLDEQPFDLDCFNPDHYHENPYGGPQRVAELMRTVREAMDRINPEIIIMSEWGTDYQVPYINSVMIHSHTGFAVTPARVAFPELYWLPHYPLGAFECALNGWMTQNDGVCTLGEALNRAPDMPWPNRERFANLDNHGPITKWRRLRSQFLEALAHGQTSDIDPYCPEDDFWRGTLFRSEHYDLLVGGYPDGTIKLPKLRKIKLDGLSSDIATGYEIDAYTLEKWSVEIERGATNIFVAVKSGFSVVLLPKSSCPPKVEATISKGIITLDLFAPWREDVTKKEFKAWIEIPGFELVGSPEISIPAVVEFKKTPATEEPGKYYFIIRGDQTLPYRGWFDME